MRVRTARRDPRLSRAQPHRARGADERRRASRGADRRDRPVVAVVAGASFVGADPASDRRWCACVPGTLVHRAVGLGRTQTALSRFEYLVVLVVLAVVIARGYLLGIVTGLVLALFLLGVQLWTGGSRARGHVHRSLPEQRRSLARRPRVPTPTARGRADPPRARVRLLRLGRAPPVEDPSGCSSPPPRFLVIDLQRVTGVDTSAVVALRKAVRLAAARGTETIVTGVSGSVRDRLTQGGLTEHTAACSFEPDLDRGLERCEDALLATFAASDGATESRGSARRACSPYLRRVEATAGAVVLRQDERTDDLYVLVEGRLAVETVTSEGRHVRVREPRPRRRRRRAELLHRRAARRRRRGSDRVCAAHLRARAAREDRGRGADGGDAISTAGSRRRWRGG